MSGPAPDAEDLVHLYLADIGRYPLLTKTEEVRLAQEMEAGRAAGERLRNGTKGVPAAEKRKLGRIAATGEDAQLTFVLSNLRLVVSIAKRYQASGVALLDLIQEGNLGLIRAVEKFDWRKDFKFSTYATWWIRQAIQRGVASTARTIRLPIHIGDRISRLDKARARLEARLGRRATIAELTTELHISGDQITKILGAARQPLSLSEPQSDDGRVELGDLVEDRSATSPYEAAAAALFPEDAQEVLSYLTQREREVLTLRFGLDGGEPCTLKEVGQHFNLSRERIRQIEARAITKLRDPSVQTRARELLTV